MSHVHFGHALTGWFDTPNKQGLFVNAEEVAVQIRAATTALERYTVERRVNDQKQVLQQLRQLVGRTSEITSGRDDSSDPYTLMSSLYHANEHMIFAARSDDTSQNMRYASEDFATNIEAVYARGSTMLDVFDIYERSDAAGKLQSVKAMKQLSEQILDGEDINRNNHIGDVKGEHGLRQIRDLLAASASREVPPYLPVSQRFLFGVVKLPNGKWKFRDANSTGSYSRTY